MIPLATIEQEIARTRAALERLERLRAEQLGKKPTPSLTESVSKLVEAAAGVFFVTPGEIRSRIRTRDVVSSRMAIMFILYNLGLSSVRIGQVFERDHSTVLKAIPQVKAWLQCDPQFKARFTKLSEAINEHTT